MVKDTAAAREETSWDMLDIGDGHRTRIEASAGTGKTWTIAAIYLRLIIERGLSARQIVVTTFTDAAAQELRERLRRVVVDAERQALALPATPDRDATYAAWLDARWQREPLLRSTDLDNLRLAQIQFDIAPIGTLHRLCIRILTEQPFACGAEFVLPPLVAGESVLDEIADDVWRLATQVDNSLAHTLATSTVADKRDEVRKALRVLLSPGVAVANAPVPVATDSGEWAQRIRDVASAENTTTAKAETLPGAWMAFADWLQGDVEPAQDDFIVPLQLVLKDDSFYKSALKNVEVRQVREFTISMLPALDAIRREGLMKMQRLARERLQVALQRRNQLRFDDLLQTVSDALASESAAGLRTLADALAGAWPVALIDEFQDTDGVQFGILDAIYRDAIGRPRGALMMIGDPKQAIYRFRGGDIDAYLHAADEADQHMTLATNHRSSRAMVAAMNEFFAVAGEALSVRADTPIRYKPVAASARRDARSYTVAGSPVERPLAIHQCDDSTLGLAELRSLALTQCANQIVQILQSLDHCIGNDAVTARDIAVLLPTAKSIRELRDLLRERGVPSVTSDQTSVFRTDVARELQIVLHSVASPGKMDALRAAAATRLYGQSFNDLQRLGEDVAAWQPVVDEFHSWHAAWSSRGVMAVVEQVLAHMAARYLATPLGERAITDLRHVGELLQAEDGMVSGKEQLLAWLARQISDAAEEEETGAADAAQLRIESDGDRVRIMTLHASKGLEFPIVFLPLMWDHKQFKPGRLFALFANGRRMIDISSAARSAELEALQDERFRVLYVALTRAIHACHVYAPAQPRIAADLQLAATGRACERIALNVLLARMLPPLNAASLATETPHVDWVAGWRFGERQVLRVAPAPAPARRVARQLSARAPAAAEMKHSFTTLTQFAHARLDPEAAAADEVDIDALVVDAQLAAIEDVGAQGVDLAGTRPSRELERLALVRGADFGNAIHAIFEQREIGESIARQPALVARCLGENGVRRRDVAADDLVAAVSARLDAALAAPLGLDAAPTLRLRDIDAADLRAEMEFHFPLERVSMQRLRDACAQHGEPDLVPASHEYLSGLMTGKIDLIFRAGRRFHVLDYKSNWLGDSLADYAGDALARAMDASHYRFQALIYSIAARRYLRERLGADAAPPGECIYLFVRAAGLAPHAGIWRHRFADALLAAADEVLAGAAREAA